MSKIIPIWDRVIIQAKPAANQTSSWIVLPESKEKPNEWNVIEVWSWVKIDVKIWDVVLYKKYSPTEIKIEGEDFLILDSEDILAKLG